MIDYGTIKAQIRITDVLRRYGIAVQDRRTYRIACPIHKGTGNNFSVNEAERVYHCFVCHSGGSVIDLVAALDATDTETAARKLADGWGISEREPEKLIIAKLSNQLNRYYNTKQSESIAIQAPDATELEEGYRDLNGRTIAHWGLRRTAKGVYIPIRNLTGKLVGYSIRQADGILPKYINSATPTRVVPYGLFENKRFICDNGFCCIVEGQFDAMRLWNRGTRNVVALMGSSITDTQAHALLAVTTRLKLILDGDEAGREGSKKIVEKWGKVFDIEVVELPEGTDPDEYYKDKEVSELCGNPLG